METNFALQIIAIAVGSLAAFISGMVYLTLKGVTRRVETLETEQKAIRREYVPAENWVRSETYTRQKLDAVLQKLAKLDGKLEVADKMPEMAGMIAREIASVIVGQTKGTEPK